MQRLLKTRPWRMLYTPVFALLVGCGGGEPRGDIDGTVTFDGNAVQAGIVSFESADGTSPVRNVAIHEGKYRAAGDTGLAPGRYRVRIAAGELGTEGPAAGAVDAQHAPVEYRPLLPPSWNTQSQLSVEVRDGRNSFNFSGTKGEQPRVDTP
ncbi:MAG: hypothetical protein U1E05_04075 [Patescibacteria group bacterium]|nr:hypothetical protein [Patescibacteria group bacterium]